MKKLIILIITLIILQACGGYAESTDSTSQPLCDSADAYTPVATDGREADWTVSLTNGTWSPDRCDWAGEAVWSNGTHTRTTHAVLQFNEAGRIELASQNLCPDGPCGAWGALELWLPSSR